MRKNKLLIKLSFRAVFLFICLTGCSNPSGNDFSITVTAPPAEGDTADVSYIVEWNVSTPEWADARIDIFVDTDTNPSAGSVMIAESLSVESTGFLWECSSFPEDDYYVRAVVYEKNREDDDYSDGTLTVFHITIDEEI